MLERIVLVVLSLWALWALCNFLLMAGFAAFHEPISAQFDGFRVRLPAWLRTALTQRELDAFREHEEGHRAHWHTWKNYARVCLFLGLTPTERRRQEYEADDHCSDPAALASGIRKTSKHPFDLHRALRLETRCNVGPAGRRQPTTRYA